MFTLDEYFGQHQSNPKAIENAMKLLAACTELQGYLAADGVIFHVNPATRTVISGNTYGGFRPQCCPQGAANSAHKTGQAVDIYDPGNKIDDYLMEHQDLLETCGIYIEHPGKTPGWSHWGIRPPASGRHVFMP